MGGAEWAVSKSSAIRALLLLLLLVLLLPLPLPLARTGTLIVIAVETAAAAAAASTTAAAAVAVAVLALADDDEAANVAAVAASVDAANFAVPDGVVSAATCAISNTNDDMFLLVTANSAERPKSSKTTLLTGSSCFSSEMVVLIGFGKTSFTFSARSLSRRASVSSGRCRASRFNTCDPIITLKLTC